MKNLSAEHTLLALLPIILVLIAIVGALVIFPKNVDPRSRASEAKPTPTMVTIPTQPAPTVASLRPSVVKDEGGARGKPETVCTDLYNPVCGRDGQIYSNSCEANVKGVIVDYPGACKAKPAM